MTASAKQHKHSSPASRSLFGEILDWMLAPLMILWPISMALEYYVSVSIANSAYDRELREKVMAVAGLLRMEDGRLSADIPPAAVSLLHADRDTSYFQVRGAANEVIAGDAVLAPIELSSDLETGTVYYTLQSAQDLRVAFMFAQVPDSSSPVLVQVGETEEKRMRLATDIIGRVLAAQFLIVPIAALLVWFGLSKGIASLNDIRARIRSRRPSDLSPIDAKDAPHELQPFILSINDLMQRLTSTVRAQRRFIADAAHQMRTPLAGLKTQAELALRQTERSDVEHAMRHIATSADRASHMINQLLALARAEGEATRPMSAIDMNEFVRSATQDWVPQALERDIDLGFDPASANAWIAGNVYLIRELLNNLIDNALRYTPAGGRVTVRVLMHDGVTVEVDDTGVGIEEADRKLVFERFYRVLGTGVEGSGLGLAIVREIAELHDAEVKVESNPTGRGSVFSVRFPAIEPPVPAPADREASPVPLPLTRPQA